MEKKKYTHYCWPQVLYQLTLLNTLMLDVKTGIWTFNLTILQHFSFTCDLRSRFKQMLINLNILRFFLLKEDAYELQMLAVDAFICRNELMTYL